MKNVSEVSIGKKEGFSMMFMLISSKMFCSYLPAAVADMGGACWYTAAAACGAVLFGFWFAASCGMGLFELFCAAFGKIAGKAVQILFSVYFYVYTAAYLNEIIKIIKIYNFAETPQSVFAAVLLAAAAMVSANSFGGAAKLSGFYIKLAAAALVLIFALSSGQCSGLRIFPFFGYGAKNIAAGFVSGISVFSDILLLIFITAELGGSKSCICAGVRSLLACGAAVVVSVFFYNCIFDYTVSSSKSSGLLEMVKNVYMGHLIQRTESLFFLMMTVFFAAAVCVLFAFSLKMFGKAFEISDRKCMIVPSAALIFGLCMIMPFGEGLNTVLKWGGAAAFAAVFLGAAVYKLKKRKRAFLAAVLCIPMIFLSGCGDIREVSDEAYAILLGVDKADGGVKLTAAVPTYESEEESRTAIYTVNAKNIPEGLNKLNLMLTRKVSLMHLKAVIFSSEIAKEGLFPYAPQIQKHIDVQNAMGVMVSEKSAESQVRFMCDSGSGNISKETELLLLSKKYNSFYPIVMFDKFCDNMTSPYISPVCALGTADGEMIGGIALFDGDKLAATLDSGEAACFMLACGKLRGVMMTFSDGSFAEITENKSKITVNGSKITVRIFAEGKCGGGSADLHKLTENAQNEIRKKTKSVLRLAARSGCDAIGIRGKAAKHYATIKKWQEFKLDEDNIDVEVKLSLKRGVNG